MGQGWRLLCVEELGGIEAEPRSPVPSTASALHFSVQGRDPGVHTVSIHQHRCTQWISGPQPLPCHFLQVVSLGSKGLRHLCS